MDRTAMSETDAILMSLVIFVPTLFALGLLFFPRGSDEYMRWWALFGTGVTLVISMWIFIDFQHMREFHSGSKDDALLTRRADAADSAMTLGDARKSDDLVARYPWIRQFNIDYYLGIDGISMALLLLTTALSFLAMWASWN